MTKIIRTKTKATGGITERERQLMTEHSKLWIARAMRTEPIDPGKIIPAIEGIYAAAGLKKPRVVIVPSPLVMAFAYGASAAIWYGATRDATDGATYDATLGATYGATRDATYDATRGATRGATYGATRDATRDATEGATRDATYDATRGATYGATEGATYGATRDATLGATEGATRGATYGATDGATYGATDGATDGATRGATRDATRDATDGATYDATLGATYGATRDATYDATRGATRGATYGATSEEGAAQACFDLAGQFGIDCARRWGSVYQGGNMWAGYDCYLTACRDILGLELTSHAAYAHWEQAAIHGGFRVMHEEFCMVSDFPEFIRIDDRNRPHCETGPSHRWRDGWSLYHWHGTRTPAEWIEDRQSLTAKVALTQENMELRRAAIEIVGWHNVLRELGAIVVDEDDDPLHGSLVEVQLPDLPRRSRFIHVQCGTGREFAIGVPNECRTVIEAQAWVAMQTVEAFKYPTVRT